LLLASVLPISYTQKERPMDFFRSMQPKDWMIAAVAFFAGAIIF
jgi:hypothetical protein